MLGSSMNMITTVIGFGVSTTFIVFICTRMICKRIRGVESRPMLEIDSRIDLEQPELRINGLEPVLVSAIPTMKFNQETFKSVEDAQCSICLGEYQDKEVLRIMPKCGHSFHLACIDVWLRKKTTCPVCRLPLQDSLESKQTRQATFSMVRSVHNPEESFTYSRQWLLPAGVGRSEGSSNNQGHLRSFSGNPEHVSGESETRH